MQLKIVMVVLMIVVMMMVVMVMMEMVMVVGMDDEGDNTDECDAGGGRCL